jgi:hypothetical protein
MVGHCRRENHYEMIGAALYRRRIVTAKWNGDGATSSWKFRESDFVVGIKAEHWLQESGMSTQSLI